MDIKWIDDGDGTLSAGVGSVILLVTPRDGGVWTAQIKIKYGIVDDATFACREDAVRWCGRRLPDIIDPIVATARAEAALAEREACAEVLKREAGRRHDALEWMPLGDPRAREIVEARNALDDATSAIRARTTPATLSTETLAAIAEARGLRVVEPELLAGLDATALATAERERDEARAELASMRADLAALTARVEAEIAAAAEAVRARTIEECVAKAMDICASYEARANLPHAKGTSLWSQRMTQASVASEVAEALRALAAEKPATPEPEEAIRAWAIEECVSAVEAIKRKMNSEMSGLDYENDTWARGGVDAADEAIAALRALAAPQPAPTEPADVDPAAGALR